jgi:hypothetical protein
MQRYLGARRLWDGLPESAQTPLALLRHAERWSPDDKQVLAALVASDVDGFNYAMHEIPAGILYGLDGASAAECQELLEDLQLLEQRLLKLGWQSKYATTIAFWRRMVDLYRAYRMQSAVRGFADYLSVHFPDWRAARSDATG